MPLYPSTPSTPRIPSTHPSFHFKAWPREPGYIQVAGVCHKDFEKGAGDQALWRPGLNYALTDPVS